MSQFTASFLPLSAYPQWSRLVAQSLTGSIYSLPEYLDVLSDVGGGSYRVLGVFEKDELVAGIALYERKSFFGTFVSPRLLLYYNGIVLKQGSDGQRAIQALERVLRELPYGRLTFRSRGPSLDVRLLVSAGWQETPSYSYVVSLEDLDNLWKRIDKNQRRLVRRCEESGMTFSEDHDFESFYALHREIHLRKGAPLYLPKEQFVRYYKALSEKKLCQLYHARLVDGRAVATQLVLLGSHPITHTVSAAAADEYLRVGVNPYLRWKVFQKLSAAGYLGNDLTDAAPNAVTRFKAQLGGDLIMNPVLSKKDSAWFQVGNSLPRVLRKGKDLLRPFRDAMFGEKKNHQGIG